MTGQIIMQIAVILLCSLFSAAEAAVIGINDSRLEKLASAGNKRAQRLKMLTSSPSGFLSSLHAAMTAVGAAGAVSAAWCFAGRLAGIMPSSLPRKAAEAVSAAIVVLVYSALFLVFAELLPRAVTKRDPERYALRLSGAACLIKAVFTPLAAVSNAIASLILRIFGIDSGSEADKVTEEEILMMSDAGAENGTIDEDENRIIKNVFAFDDMTAGQICTHRTDVSVLWSEDPTEVWEETIHRTRHSAFPVCGERVDNVIGVLDAKDYFRLDDKSRENIMANAVREPCFVHENMKADRLFAQMKRKGADHFVIVVDEYGGMSGIITVTDLVEELVGDFDDDELDTAEAVFTQLADDCWLIPGITPLGDVCEELDITLPEDKYDAFDTFGGFVIAVLGEIPKDGTQTTIESEGLHIEVQEINHHRIELCRVTKLPSPSDETDRTAGEE